MTRDRTYEGSTEFSIWIRNQPELDSQYGYRAYDTDYIWWNSYSNKFMFIEEKRYGWDIIKAGPHTIFSRINKLCAKDNLYRGYHLICFENTNPDDGRIQLNYQDITKEDLIKFFQFDEQVIKKYRTIETGIISQKLPRKIVDNLPKRK